MGILTDPERIPADHARISDDDLIGSKVWAALQGVRMSTFYGVLSKSRARRRYDAEHPGEPPTALPGDIPDPDQYAGSTPLWLMKTFRAWTARRPGQSTARGKTGPRHRERTVVRIRVPFGCPHCGRAITGADLDKKDA